MHRFSPFCSEDECDVSGHAPADVQRLETAFVSGGVGAARGEHRRRQLFSFAAARTLTELSQAERQALLASTDTEARLRAATGSVEAGRSWLAARATLSGLE